MGNVPEEQEEDKNLTDKQEGLLAWSEELEAILGADDFQKITIICNLLAQNRDNITTVINLLKEKPQTQQEDEQA